MNSDEKRRFVSAKASESLYRLKLTGAKTFRLEMSIHSQRSACSVPFPASSTKLQALKADLIALRKQDPSMHAVVFTHVRQTHRHVTSLLGELGITACGFDGSGHVRKRHAMIREFQDSASAAAGEAKVFVVTVKVGAVGITLTAASRVYLMEPCFEPAQEVQVAGRIHRLGQTKDVLIKRFVFRDSLEANIVKLHGRILTPATAADRIVIVDGGHFYIGRRALLHMAWHVSGGRRDPAQGRGAARRMTQRAEGACDRMIGADDAGSGERGSGRRRGAAQNKRI